MTNLEGVTKTQISKTQTSDPEKLRPLCVSKTQIPEKLRHLEKRRPVGVSKKHISILSSTTEQNRTETLLKCQKPSSQGTNPLLIWGHQLGENIQTKKLYTVVGKISIVN